MKCCDFTLPLPEENLACDEALLNLCEETGEEVLRVWEPSKYFVVVGYANKVATEVNLPFCHANTIPVLRRCTGGGTVLQGPGVLNYTLILRIEAAGPCRSISTTNDFVMQRHQESMGSLLGARVERQGQTDLTIGGLKFCGNAQRRQQRCLMFHGSYLLHLDISLVEKALPLPARQPDYRSNRSHADFLMNLKLPAAHLKSVLARTWNAREPLAQLPMNRIHDLAQSKYLLKDWTFKF